jgi:hypothetical protein
VLCKNNVMENKCFGNMNWALMWNGVKIQLHIKYIINIKNYTFFKVG